MKDDATSADTEKSAASATGIPSGVTLIRDLEYAKVGAKRLLLDLYVPEKVERKLPLVVWVHGGGWVGGDKFPYPVEFTATRDYVVACIKYRFSNEGTFPAQIYDCKGAIRWLRANADKYPYDPQRIGAFGCSAGGHLVALLGTAGGVKELEGDVGGNLDQSSRVQAVCNWCGPTDLTLCAPPAAPQVLVDVTRQFLGGPPEEFAKRARAASPVAYVNKETAPFLNVHGAIDSVVPVVHAELLDAALRKAGVESTLCVIKDGDHGAWNPKMSERLKAFFARHLKSGAGK